MRFTIARKLASSGLFPLSRLAWFAVYLGGTELVLLLLKVVLKFFGAASQASSLNIWTGLLAIVLVLLLIFLGLRWFRNHVMWRLRNRLIVTYLFIGGVPLFLVLLLAFMAAYLFAGQFAIFLAENDLRVQLQRLHNANVATAQDIAQHGLIKSSTVREQTKQHDDLFPGRTVSVVSGSSGPKWLDDNFTGVVVDGDAIYLRAAKVVSGPQPVVVISSIPLDKQLLSDIATNLGAITISPLNKGTTSEAAARNPHFLVKGNSSQSNISAGSLPRPKFSWDLGFDTYAQIPTTDWATGKTAENLEIATGTRLSTLYSRLSVSVGGYADIVSVALVASGILLALMVLVALLIGVRLTRTITLSVANLYEATQHINQGDFSQRIQVREKDQLATLQVAFNSMTDSLEQLIAEQKEKERLQGELAIAQEVQALLFPSATSSTATLELHGICRPARIVSGDYYDFLSYGSEQVGIALGDISGKGISAALLMATIHSAVRAYEQNQLLTRQESMAAGRHKESGSVGLALHAAPPRSPAQVLWLLNRQLYQSTPQEKYATLFLSFYDGHRRELIYSNAGHLPPLILGADGSIQRLTVGGTVIGLFDHVEYQEAIADLRPGDIFIAFSDGVTEPENEFGEFGEERLLETIETYRHLPLERISEHVISALQDWIGSTEQPDDITLVLARPRD